MGAVLLGLLVPAATAPAAQANSPWWGVNSTSRPANLVPGANATIIARAANIGDANATAPITITDRLPQGLTAKSVAFYPTMHWEPGAAGNGGISEAEDLGTKGPLAALELCTVAEAGRLLTCTWPDIAELEAKGLSKALAEEEFGRFFVEPYVGRFELSIPVKVAAEPPPGLQNEVAVSGGGGPPREIAQPLRLSEEPAPFGIEDYELRPEEAGGALDTRAGSHPFQLTTYLSFNQTAETQAVPAAPVGMPKDLSFPLPAGLLANLSGRPRCTLAQFATLTTPLGANCPSSSVIGVAIVYLPGVAAQGGSIDPIFNLTPARGEPARFGFNVLGPVILDTSLRSGSGGDYGATVTAPNITQLVSTVANEVVFWGDPGDPRHDLSRGVECLQANRDLSGGNFTCIPQDEKHSVPLLTLPTSCPADPLAEPFASTMEADAWNEEPFLGLHPAATYALHEQGGPPLGMEGCNQVPFAPAIAAEPTSDAATSPTGLNFDLSTEDEGLSNPEGLAQSAIKEAVVTLPQGFTTNPSVAAGLEACTEASYEAEALDSEAGENCPNASKIGTVEAESPLVEGKVTGSLFVAKQHDNPFHNLLTLYMVLRNPELGVIVKAAGKVEANPVTGQLTTSFDDLPQLPISRFDLAFRSGTRSPLITPPACGTYTVHAALYPYSEPNTPLQDESSFQITTGPEGQGCPSGGVPPFHPNLEAGTINNAAGTYSPFYTHISRRDSEQEITHFSIKLPPGVIGKLAGVSECSDAQIAAAKAREHEGGGAEEEQSPSCPAASQVGRTLVGSGVGGVLAYAPGKIYLAGPYHGSALSLVSVTAAKVGPFDLGTVVVRFALKINPETAEVSVDGQGSDPIPHIVDGIPVHLRDIRAYVDRPEFTLNPTGCERTSTASTVLGSGLDFASEADDQPVTVTSPFQAADCASLGFKPKLALSLKGGTKRGATPAFKAVLSARPGDANIGAAQVTLPSSEYLEQAHIGTVCTRTQFAQGTVPGEKCPAASIYGFAKAVTPILSEPLQGPVYLRSSSHPLPDLVAALNNKQVNIDLDGHIDAVHKKGSEVSKIRNTFEAVPDAPVTQFTLEMQGGNKGLLVNSTNICAQKNHAIADLTGHNGKIYDTNPVLSAPCGKQSHKGHKRSGAHR